MNKNVRAIASIMIIVLAVLLIVIFIEYNQKRENDYNKPHNVMHDSGEPILNDKSGEEQSLVESGEGFIIAQESGEEKEPVEVFSGEEKVDDKKPPKKFEKKDLPRDCTNEPPVISSHTETSNQEKQEILNEIDDALKGLLDAVGKVKTVDESKLDASLESEVEP